MLTNDLAWDDRVQRHLPLLNVWAPAVSGRQFWASAFIFTFQHPDAAARLRQVRWFFSPSATAGERVAFAKRSNVEFALLRKNREAGHWRSAGWRIVASHGRYEVLRLE